MYKESLGIFPKLFLLFCKSEERANVSDNSIAMNGTSKMPLSEALPAMMCMLVVLAFVLIIYCVMPCIRACKRKKYERENWWEIDPRWNQDKFSFVPNFPVDYVNDKKYSTLAYSLEASVKSASSVLTTEISLSTDDQSSSTEQSFNSGPEFSVKNEVQSRQSLKKPTTGVKSESVGSARNKVDTMLKTLDEVPKTVRTIVRTANVSSGDDKPTIKQFKKEAAIKKEPKKEIEFKRKPRERSIPRESKELPLNKAKESPKPSQEGIRNSSFDALVASTRKTNPPKKKNGTARSNRTMKK